MVATSETALPAPAEPAAESVTTPRNIGLVPTASMITGAAVALVWFWIPLSIMVIGVSSIPSVIGFLLSGVVFIYLMRGVEWVERTRSEAVFGLGIGIPPRQLSPHTGFQGWAHQLWLDISSTRFWKGVCHHYLRITYDMLDLFSAPDRRV